MSLLESLSKKAGGGIISGILDFLADLFDKISPQHQAARQEASEAKALEQKQVADIDAKDKALEDEATSLEANRDINLKQQQASKQKADDDAKQIEEVKKSGEKAITDIKSKSDSTLLHDDF